MTLSQQAVEAALNHFDDPEMAWHGFIGRHGRTIAAEVRRLRVENAELRDLNRRLVKETTDTRFELVRLERFHIQRQLSDKPPLGGC